MEIQTISITLITPHSDEPADRLRDTTDLQESQALVGIIRRPIVVPDGKYFICVAGNRTVTAAKQRGLTEIEVEVRILDEEQQAQILIQSNVQRPLTKVQLAQIAGKWIERYTDEASGDPQALRAIRGRVRQLLGVSRTELHGLEKLFHSPLEIQQAVKKAEGGETEGALTWTDFKSDYSPLSPEVMSTKWSERGGKKGSTVDDSVNDLPEVDVHDGLTAIRDARSAMADFLAVARQVDEMGLALLREGIMPLFQQMARAQVALGFTKE